MQTNSFFEFTHIHTNGVRLHTALAGPQQGPLVVMLHGFPEYWRGWARQAAHLAQHGYRVALPDQRGYNLSGKPEGVRAYRVETLVEDVFGLAEALGYERFHLAGHDWGAMVAWQAALRRPERLEKLVIANVPHPDVMQRFLLSSFEQIRKSWYIFFFQLPGLPEWLMRRRDCALLRRMMRESARPDTFSPSDLEAYAAAWRQPGALTAMVNWYRAAFRGAARSLWRTSNRSQEGASRRVVMPALILWGVKDVALSYDMAAASLELCERGGLVPFEDATHWVQHDKADEAGRLILEFLNG